MTKEFPIDETDIVEIIENLPNDENEIKNIAEQFVDRMQKRSEDWASDILLQLPLTPKEWLERGSK